MQNRFEKQRIIFITHYDITADKDNFLDKDRIIKKLPKTNKQINKMSIVKFVQKININFAQLSCGKRSLDIFS